MRTRRRAVLGSALGQAAGSSRPQADVRPCAAKSHMKNLDRIEAARASKDDNALFEAMLQVFREGPTRELVPTLCELVLEDWHQQHEDVVLVLQDLKDGRAAQPLYRAATIRFDHLARWNNLREFQRKCTWALADIGSENARAYLQELARVDDEHLAEYAQRRLDHWDAELGRKGPA